MVVCMVDGLIWPKDQGCKVMIAGADEPLLVLVLLLAIFIIGFGTGETHITFIDAIFAKILLTRDTFNQFIGLDFRPT
jgi:hypothetical protein